MKTKEKKQWGIKVRDKWWVQAANQDAIYSSKTEALKDAREWNSMVKKKIYSVEEYEDGV
tara:strand:+ start:1994 stop:2173 length:180 start_codon:yes stop_codon:yes gene_type:complete